ncbi:NAD(P)H-dependent oxidoreductase [Microbacterium excoecariae]|uniref:NAD(P)H-dependent oxidoreductase n=1 Tax=Microbacterium excoecariae TaxID=2715210 RepID=UPI0014081243|nr:NAD(P)H-dependent oxidoreductase [Microbacterium excoecariae]NHI17695.1 NAD(P)H-dependent oxidoreductase [Microbacterium excoecariae]
MNVTVVAGNPKPGSRTLEAGRILAREFSTEWQEVDVVTLGAGLLGWGDEAVAAAVTTVAESDLIIVASPTFKATYTGILKLFLDQFETGTGLAGVTAIPLMLGAGPAHFMAPELLLKPLLVELGAVVPVQGLYLSDKTYADEGALDAWLGRWRAAVTATTGLARA